MVTRPSSKIRQRGSLVAEILVAVSVLIIAAFPLMSAYVVTQKSVRRSYQHAVAMELIDGEMEVLLRGEWHEFAQGAQPYNLPGDAAKNLPPGHATLTVSGNHVRLEWKPDRAGDPVVREADAK